MKTIRHGNYSMEIPLEHRPGRTRRARMSQASALVTAPGGLQAYSKFQPNS
jgi:hypothetical protein